MHKVSFVLLAVSIIFTTSSGAAGGEPGERIERLHRDALVFDAHCDTAMRLIGHEPIDLGDRLETGHMDLPRMAEGGLDAQIFACWLNPDLPEDQWIKQVLRMIDGVWGQAEKYPDRMEVALTGADVRRITGGGRLAAVIGIEGGRAIMDDLAVLRDYHRLGVRCMTLTWNNTNGWADSSTDTMRWGGLNDHGREVVREMNRLGMLVDCSHVSDSTLFDVLETSTDPILISHSCTRALADVSRNVSDDGLRALRENGGVICINYYPGFIDAAYFEQAMKLWGEFRAAIDTLSAVYGGDRGKAWRELRPAFREKMDAIEKPTVGDLADHIDHAVEMAGIDHVGLGSDFDGISFGPEGLEDVSKLPAITEELVRRGYSDDDIRKILGGNLLRLVERVCR